MIFNQSIYNTDSFSSSTSGIELRFVSGFLRGFFFEPSAGIYFRIHGASSFRSTSEGSLRPVMNVPKPAIIMVVKVPNVVYQMYEIR